LKIKNKHIKNNIEEFLKKSGIYEKVKDIAIKIVIAYKLAEQ